MFYFLDDIIVSITGSQLVFIFARIVLTLLFWISLYILFYDRKKEIIIPNKALTAIYSIYTFFLISITLLKGSLPGRHYNFIPFKSFLDFSEVNINIAILNIATNLLMLLPIGIILQLWLKRLSFSLLIVFLTSLGIEVLQFIFKKGVLDIDDLILNTFGGLMGILISRYVFSTRSRK